MEKSDSSQMGDEITMVLKDKNGNVKRTVKITGNKNIGKKEEIKYGNTKRRIS